MSDKGISSGRPTAPATPATHLRGGGRSSFRWVVLGLATFMQVGVSLPQQTPAAIGPLLTHALGLSRTELGLLTSAIWGGMLIGMLPFGMLVDRYGERSMLLVGGTVLAAFLLLAARAATFRGLFVALVPAAIGASCASPGGTRALAAWFEPRLRGTAMGIRQTGVTAAGVLAAIILPPIGLAFGWQAAFVTVAGLALTGMLAFVLFYREPPVDSRVARRRLHMRALLRSRTWVAATAYGWMFMGALGSVVAYLAVSLNQDAGLSPVEAGLLLAVLQLGGIAGRLGFGVLSDRLGSRGAVMSLSAALAVAACLAMALLGHGAAGVPGLVAIALLLGLSCMGWNALYITLSAEVVPVEQAATAVGAGTTITFVGMFAVPPVFGLIADHTGSYALSWLALAGWAAIGLLVGLTVRDGTMTRRSGAG
ncbi:MAG TPA: MFS transporter [Candidatus Eisenbacteria bacterium]|nr:MFS transporter [Candidatus Eisenbacteria bacterium]